MLESTVPSSWLRLRNPRFSAARWRIWIAIQAIHWLAPLTGWCSTKSKFYYFRHSDLKLGVTQGKDSTLTMGHPALTTHAFLLDLHSSCHPSLAGSWTHATWHPDSLEGSSLSLNILCSRCSLSSQVFQPANLSLWPWPRNLIFIPALHLFRTVFWKRGLGFRVRRFWLKSCYPHKQTKIGG